MFVCRSFSLSLYGLRNSLIVSMTTQKNSSFHYSFYAGRLESFFGPVKTVPSGSGSKRKEPPAKKGGKGGPKKGKLGGVGKKA